MPRHRRVLFYLTLWLLVTPKFSSARQAPTYDRAESLIRHGQLDEGIAMLKPLLDSEPRNLKVLNRLGIALTAKGDFAGANREFRRALRIDPHFQAALQNLAVNEFVQKDLV